MSELRVKQESEETSGTLVPAASAMSVKGKSNDPHTTRIKEAYLLWASFQY